MTPLKSPFVIGSLPNAWLHADLPPVHRRHLLPDPTEFENQLCSSNISIVLSTGSKPTHRPAEASGDLLYVYQAGASAGGKERLRECFKLARGRAKELEALLAGSL